jgi:four helix bundle protein
MIRTFEELDCWKKTASLRKSLGALVKLFPQEEKFRLVDQMTRALRSVTANIAEGYGRYHYLESIQFCRQSRGSLYEIIDHLIVACEEKLITEAQLNNYKIEIQQCLAILNGYINYFAKAKSEVNKVSEPEMHYQIIDNE